MNLGTIIYIPPHGRLHSEACMANLAKFPTRHPLYILSDDTTWPVSRAITNPEIFRGKPAWALNNFIFFKALELARDVGLEPFIYLESDSRVGCAGWDDILFAEYFTRYPNGIACAGSPVVWDVNAGGKEFAMKVIAKACAYQAESGMPACFYAGKSPHDRSGGYVYPNGSCAIYHTSALLRIFAGFDADITGNARKLTAWDMEIGRRLWHNHGACAIDHVGWLAKAYSGFGDVITSEAERLEMLRNGSKVVVHQVKSDAQP